MTLFWQTSCNAIPLIYWSRNEVYTHLEKTEGSITNDNPEKLATLGTQDEDKQNIQKHHNTICVRHHHTLTNTNNVNKT